MKNLNEFISASEFVSEAKTANFGTLVKVAMPKEKMSIFAAYNTETSAVGVALCKPMSIEDVNTEYKAIELKAKQQFGLKIEQSWPDFRDDYDIESTGPDAEYVLFYETGNKSQGYNADAYWINIGRPGCMKIENA